MSTNIDNITLLFFKRICDVYDEETQKAYEEYGENATEFEESELHKFDYYELGFSEFVEISAEHSRGINDLLDLIVKDFPKYENIDIFLPSMDDTESHILTMNESWLLETITNLYTYTSELDNNKLLQVYNFNTTYERVEALDGHRIGMRTLEKQKILQKDNNVMLHRKCMPVFKKIMDKKSDAEVKVYQDKKYIRVEGKDFTYIVRRVDGEYFKVNQMLTDDRDYIFNADRENMLSVMKYNCDMVKQEQKPVIFHSEKGKLYSYMATSRYETFDELETKDNMMDNDLYIAFNPYFIADAFSIIDCDNPICRGKNNKSPMFIDGNEYSFLILPVNIGNGDVMDKIRGHINIAA